MAATAEDTDIGYGTLFKKKTGPSTYTVLAEVVEFNPPEMSRDAVDFTHMTSPDMWAEYKPGIRDANECSLVYNLIPGEADDDLVGDSFATNVVEEWEVEYPNGAKLAIKGFFTAHAAATPLRDKMTGSATFKISGKPVMTPAP